MDAALCWKRLYLFLKISAIAFIVFSPHDEMRLWSWLMRYQAIKLQVVLLSFLSPLHRRNYCSITRVLDEYLSQDVVKALQQRQVLTKLLSSLCQFVQQRRFHLFAVDCTPSQRIFSPTLEDRSYVYAPNAVCGNKPVTLGHKYSIATYLPEKPNANTPPWLIPLSCTRIDTTQHAELTGMEQIATCINSRSEFKNQLSVSLGDTAYNNPLCLSIAKTI